MTRPVPRGRRAKGRTLAIKPQRDYALSDADRDAFDEGALADAEALARKLCGEAPYSREEVKGWRIAGVIRALIGIIRRMVASRTAGRVRELEQENAELRALRAGALRDSQIAEDNARLVGENRELRILYERCRREAARWELAMPRHREAVGPELPWAREG